MRGLMISSLVLGMVLAVLSLFYMMIVHHARMDAYSDYSFSGIPYQRVSEATIETGLISLGIMFYFVLLYIITLVKLKTTTMKVLSIIGLSFTGIMIAWDALMMTAPRVVSFDEVAPAWIFMGVIYFGFSVPGIVHAFRSNA